MHYSKNIFVLLYGKVYSNKIKIVYIYFWLILLSLFFNCLLYFALHICYAGQKRVQFSVLNVCCRYLTCTKRNDGRITDKDSADEDDARLVDNLSEKLTQHSGGSCLTDGKRINNRSEGSKTVSNEVCDGLLPFTNEFFSESNYLSYTNIALELFEKFFH